MAGAGGNVCKGTGRVKDNSINKAALEREGDKGATRVILENLVWVMTNLIRTMRVRVKAMLEGYK